MYCDSGVGRCVATILWVAFFSLVLASCSGGGGGNTTSYTVSASAGAGGSISPANVTVNSGATANFTLTPDSGNSIGSVTGCNGSLLGTTYTTGAINANCTVTASFVSSTLPTVSITDASVNEGDTGTTNLVFTVTLSALANGNVSVDYATSDGSPATGSATVGDDYIAGTSTLTIPAASTSATISIIILGDTNVEGDETLTLALNNPSGNATLGSFTATGTILNDDATGLLNDTGITTCSDDSTNDLACPQATHPEQDADYGRDAQAAAGTLVKVGGGRAGFDFTKLDSSGNPLADQAAIYTTTPWDCVRDNVTGLAWEVKTTDSGLRDRNHTYTWYNSTGVNDGGAPGTSSGGICADNLNCDTEKYVAAVNAANLCGRNDWRLPSAEELSSLVDSSIAHPGPAIDSTYFPNTLSSKVYLSSSPIAGISGFAWFVDFYGSFVSSSGKSSAGYVRLVRGGQ